jgi:hypothetical protein
LGRALHLIERDPERPRDQILRRPHRLIEDIQIIERQLCRAP